MSLQAFTGALRVVARASSWMAAAGFVFAVPACSQGMAVKIDSASQGGQDPAFSLAPARAEEQFDLAMRYEAGNGLAADDAWAEYWAWRAAVQGHGLAREWLRQRARTEPLEAVMVFDVLNGAPKKVHRSAELWLVLAGPDPSVSAETRRHRLAQSFPIIREQALRGNAWAKYLVGAVNEFAFADSSEARRWYSESAELGNVLAQDSLGHLYEEGRGVAADSAEAARWYLKAAEQGLPFAQWRLGSLYATGRGVAHDEEQALRWLRAAAQAGNADASSGIRIIEARARARKASPAAP